MSTQLEALRRHVAQRPSPPATSPGRGSVVVLGSGKGGVGTTTLSALLAISTAARGSRVLLVDADPVVGALALLLGAPRSPGIGALRGGETEAEELLVPLTDGLTLLPGGGAAEEAGLSGAERQALLRRILPLLPRYDAVVIDGGSRLESVMAAGALGVGRVLAVCEPDRIAVAATYALMKALGDRLPGTPVEILINRTAAVLADQVAEEVQGAARHFLRRTIGYCGAVPDDRCLRAGIQAGMSIQDAVTGSPAAQAIQEVGLKIFHQLSTRSLALGERQPTPRRF